MPSALNTFVMRRADGSAVVGGVCDSEWINGKFCAKRADREPLPGLMRDPAPPSKAPSAPPLICKCELSQTVRHQMICTGDCCAAGDWIRVDRRAKKWKGVEEEFEE
jgi:hypothetical protein